MKRLFFITFLLSTINSFNQNIIYQDYFHGGVSCSGIDLFGQGGVVNGYIPVHIEGGSVIKKVFLITNHFNDLTNEDLILNNVNIDLISINDEISLPFNFQTNPPWNLVSLKTGLFDLTNSIEIIDSIFFITPEIINIIDQLTYGGFYIVVLYENLLFPLVNIVIVQNYQNCGPSLVYDINNINTIYAENEIGLTINSTSTLYEDTDAAQIIIEEDTIGLIHAGLGGDPLGSWGSAFGNSYYQNGTFYGLSDDVPNTTVNGTDAIANIQPYLTSTNSVNIQYNYYTEGQPNPQAPFSNILWQLFLTYTTTCAEFEATVLEDVELCQGDTTILQVTGGNTYEWQPQEGLSCYDCPNPTYNDTITRWYTVKINNNDSCSKTLPVHVKVLPAPLIPILSSSPTLCSDSSGVITVQQMDNTYQYSLESGAFQNESTFQNLAAGTYTVITKNEDGCTSQPSTITIEEINPTQAQFSATPTQGEIPLTVQFNNQSTDATDYTWYIGNDTINDISPSYIFTETGEFTASLIAYDTYPWCSDTTEVLKIITEYPFNIIIPTTYFSYTDSYQIYTSRVSQLDYTLFNSIGQQVYHKHFVPNTGYSPLWERKDVARGVYLYTIKVVGEDGEVKEIVGRVLVM